MAASRITKDQTRKLRTVASKHFGDCDCRRPTGSGDGYVCDYHRWLNEEFSVASTLALTFYQAGRAIDLLDGQKTSTPKAPKVAPDEADNAPAWRGRYDVPGTPGMVTPAQANAIARLEDALGWTGQPDRLQGMIRRQLGRPSNVHVPVHGLANRQASSLITGLQRLVDHQREERVATGA